MVEVEPAAQPAAPANWLMAGKRGVIGGVVENSVTHLLVIPLMLVVRHVFADRAPKCGFVDQDPAIQALRLDRADEALGEGIQFGRARGQANDVAAGVREQRSELGAVLANAP